MNVFAGGLMIEGFLVPLVVVGLAELGDKTQLSILLLSSKTKDHLQLFLGVLAGFLLVDGFAVLAGSWITSIVSLDVLKLISAVVFILFGVLAFRGGESENSGRVYGKSTLISGFALISLTEWGDKTQIMAGLFATKYNPVLVLAGSMVALALLSLAAIYLGRVLSTKMEKSVISRVAGVVFIIMGVSLLLL
ncbi:MAG: TMEM165/GDT1 family protein [Candidatus Altiarchaeota archaeon]